jgi:phosphoglycolate phosphatase-like HAD superfamily hydrolase
MKAVLFDIDGTLILTGGAGQRAFAQTFAADFGVPAISKQVNFAGRSDRAIACELMRVHDIEPSEVNWQRFRSGYLARLPEALRTGDGHVLPGVTRLLDELAGLPVHVGLLTGNVRDGAQRKLSHYNLWHRFAFGGFGDEHVDRRDIAVAAVAAARKQVPSNGHPSATRETVVVIGDTEQDIQCARAIGAHAVAVATGLTPATALAAENPDLLIENLEDAAALLDLLAA